MASVSTGGVNSAPLKNCKRCQKNALSGPKCVKCGTVSHSSCVSLLKSVLVIDEKSIICCAPDEPQPRVENIKVSEQDLSFKDALDDHKTGKIEEIEIGYLKELIKQKDMLISNQQVCIQSLQCQITLLNKLNEETINKQVLSSAESSNGKGNNSANVKVNQSKTWPSLRSFNEKDNFRFAKSSVVENNVNQTAVNLQCATLTKKNSLPADANKNKPAAANKVITPSQVTQAIQEAVNKNQPIISNDNGFTEVSYKRKYKTNNSNLNKPIIGELELDSDAPLKASTKFVFLHAYKMNPATTEEEVITFLKPKFPEVLCEKLNSWYPEFYSSFKVSVHEANLSSAMKPSVWPKGTWVNRFFHRRRPQNQQK